MIRKNPKIFPDTEILLINSVLVHISLGRSFDFCKTIMKKDLRPLPDFPMPLPSLITFDYPEFSLLSRPTPSPQSR